LKNWALISIASIVLFGSGLLVGREFPRKHFQLLRENSYFLLDSSTGHLCVLDLPNSDYVSATSTPNLVDQAVQSSQGKTPVNMPNCEK
jgi:hypothetical protein